MTDFHFVEVQTITRTFTVTAADRASAERKAKSLEGAHSFSSYKEHPVSLDLTCWTSPASVAAQKEAVK